MSLDDDESAAVKNLYEHLKEVAKIMDRLFATGLEPTFNVGRNANGSHEVQNFTVARRVKEVLPARLLGIKT